MQSIRSIAVIGAGQMGRGIAQVAAAAGIDVVLSDVSVAHAEKGRATIASGLEKLVAKGKLDAAARDAQIARIRPVDAIASLGDCQLALEAATENLEIKLGILRSVDERLPKGAILATNTSSISITKLAAATGRPELVIGMHFMNPVPLMKIVELIRGQATSAESLAITAGLCTTLGKTGIEAADYPGFIANRILMPMINEAVFALMEGVGTAEAIDGVMKLGMNHPMGPLTLADFIGLDVCLAILNVLHDGLGDPKYRPCPLLKRMVAAGHLGRKSGRGFYQY